MSGSLFVKTKRFFPLSSHSSPSLKSKFNSCYSPFLNFIFNFTIFVVLILLTLGNGENVKTLDFTVIRLWWFHFVYSYSLWIFEQYLMSFICHNVLQQERLEKEAEIRRVREELLRQQANQKDSSYWIETCCNFSILCFVISSYARIKSCTGWAF